MRWQAVGIWFSGNTGVFEMKAMVIGYGNAGKRHHEAYRRMGMDVIVADSRALEGVTVTKWRDHLPDVDIVSICTPDEFHFEQAVECLMSGKHVMVEKPPCLRMDEMLFLEKWTKEHPEQGFACCLPLPWRFSDFADEITALGPVYQIELEYNYGRRRKLVDGWRAHRDYSMVLGGGLHMLDLMLWLVPDRPRDGFAMGTSTTKVRNDTVQAVMKMKSGAIARLGINGGYEGRHYHKVAVHGRDGVAAMETRDDVDHLAPIKVFVETLERGERVSSARLWEAMRLCFEIEGQL